jgi:hypothetical protein
MKTRIAIALVLSAVLVGCTTPLADAVSNANKQMEHKGSPFRYVARDDTSMVMTLLPLPTGPTKAIDSLAQQVLASIRSEELKKGRSTANVEEVRHLQDGREVWVLHTLSAGIAYVVAFENPSAPKSDIRISGPTTYQK